MKEILDYLEASLEQCKTDVCILTYLRGLRNAAQPQFIPTLMNYALKGGKSALEALLAIRNVQSVKLSEEVGAFTFTKKLI